MFRILLLALFTSVSAQIASAAPRAYDIDYSASKIEFLYDFNNQQTKGQFPEFRGDVVLDFQNLKNSKIDVAIDARTAKGGFVFATSALRGATVLYVKKHPTISFVSQNIQLKGSIATIKGNITVRGVTRPLVLKARFFQTEGQDPKDRDSLILQITGTINRGEFGADGYKDMVGDKLAIKITAKINRR